MQAFPTPRDTARIATPDGVHIAVQHWGRTDGAEVLFIHGYSLSHLCWSHQVTSPALQHLRMVTFDLRGHGGSDQPQDPGCYREGRRWACDLRAIMDHAALRRPVVVAWSYGLRPVVDYISEFGTDRIAGLNIVGSRLSAAHGTASVEMAALQSGMASPDLATNIASTIGFVRACAATWDETDFATTLASAMVVPHQVRSALLGRTLDAEALFRKVNFPVLISHGGQDRIIPKQAAEQSAAIIPGAALSIFPGTGHAPFLEDPARYSMELAKFVARSQGRQG